MFLEEGAVEVVTGVNLPMVIKLATYTGQDSLSEIARKICDQGRQGIYLAGALLAPRERAERIDVAERALWVTGRLGLHARAAANLVRVANQFQSDITLKRLDNQGGGRQIHSEHSNVGCEPRYRIACARRWSGRRSGS